MKSRKNVTNENIKKSFLKKAPNCGVIAYFFYEAFDPIMKRINTVYEYFDEPGFGTFAPFFDFSLLFKTFF